MDNTTIGGVSEVDEIVYRQDDIKLLNQQEGTPAESVEILPRGFTQNRKKPGRDPFEGA